MISVVLLSADNGTHIKFTYQEIMYTKKIV